MKTKILFFCGIILGTIFLGVAQPHVSGPVSVFPVGGGGSSVTGSWNFISPLSVDTTNVGIAAKGITETYLADAIVIGWKQFGRITVSARGIKNGLSIYTNDNRMFGPDTAGTTTSGLQEAIDSVSKSNKINQYAAAISLYLDPGYYYFTNSLLISNGAVTGIKIEGNTMVDTKLVYAGVTTVSNTITITGTSTNLLYAPMAVEIRNVGFSAIANNTNTLLYVDHYSYLNIENCDFRSWVSMTNDYVGAGLSASGVQSGTPGLVGLKISGSGDHGTFLRNTFFGDLATALDVKCDHLNAYNFKTFKIGQDGDENPFTTMWPATSPYSIGAAILFRGGFLECSLIQPHFFKASIGLAFLSPGTIPVQIISPCNEGTVVHIASVTLPDNPIVQLVASTDSLAEIKEYQIDTNPYGITTEVFGKFTTSFLYSRASGSASSRIVLNWLSFTNAIISDLILRNSDTAPTPTTIGSGNGVLWVSNSILYYSHTLGGTTNDAVKIAP